MKSNYAEMAYRLISRYILLSAILDEEIIQHTQHNTTQHNTVQHNTIQHNTHTKTHTHTHTHRQYIRYNTTLAVTIMSFYRLVNILMCKLV